MTTHLTLDQVAAVAAFEREHGRSVPVPFGPRRDRLLRWAGYGAVAIQSDVQWMDPVVVVIEQDGRTEELADAR